MSSKKRLLTIVLPCLAAGLLAGCDKKITITQVPTFYTPQLKSIVVVPFRNHTNYKGAGNIVADQVAAGLMANGAYAVQNRNDLKSLMDQNDLNIALGADPAAAANQLKKFTRAQAMLTGTVTTYAGTTNRQPKRDPVYSYDKKGRQYISGYRSYVHTRNEGNVAVTMELIRLSDNATIYATPEPAWARVWAEGSPPKKDPHACLSESAGIVARDIVSRVAPTRRQIKINEDKALRTATELYDNEWTYEDTFRTTDEKMFVVVALPPSCDRNRFRITIVRKGERRDLAVQDIQWSKKHAGFGYRFNPKDIAAKGGGPGKYEVKFYSGPKPVMRQDFRIR